MLGHLAGHLAGLLLGLSIAALIGGCSFSASYDNTYYQCAVDDACPDGYGCVRGVCLAGVDSSAGTCGNMTLARQDFSVGDVSDFDDSPIWDIYGNQATIATADGALVMDIPDTDEDVGSGFEVEEIFPRAGSEISVEIVERSTDNVSRAYLLIEDRNDDGVEFYERAGTLHAVLRTSPADIPLAELEFDPVDHRFWRIAERDGEFVFSTSPDGAQWTEQARTIGEAIDGWLGAKVGLWKWGTGGGPARLVVDNLNGGASEQNFCASAALQDDFDDGVRHPDWQLRVSGVCTAEERDGRLGFTFSESGSVCRYRTYTLFDLRTSTISIEAPLVDVEGMEQCIKLYLPGGQDIQFELTQGVLVGEKSLTDDGGTVFSVEFDPDAHRFWRFRGEGDTVFWELSADGRTWQVMASQQSPTWDLGQVFIELIGHSEGGIIDNFGLGFDNLNITPY